MGKKIIVTILVATLCIGGSYFFWKKENNTVTYLTDTVKMGDLQKAVIASGTVRSYKRVEVGAQVSGKIEKIYVKLGQQVKQGDLIAEIDAKSQVNSLTTAQAQLTSYQAQLKAKRITYNVASSAYQRVNKLYTQKAVSLNDLETAKNNLAIAESAIEETLAYIQQTEIQINTAKTNLSYTKIVSPIDGTIISIPVSEGQTVNANQTTPTIVQVADLDKMLIKIEISEGDITKVKKGMKVEFNTLSEPDYTYQGVIASVDPATTTLTDNEYSESVTDTNAVYYYANVVVENPEHKLHIGMTTQNRILIADVENTLLVPTMTLQKQGNKTLVNVLNDENNVEQREVVTGLNDDVNTQIISGLKEGEKVVASQVSEGEQVGRTPKGPRMF